MLQKLSHFVKLKLLHALKVVASYKSPCSIGKLQVMTRPKFPLNEDKEDLGMLYFAQKMPRNKFSPVHVIVAHFRKGHSQLLDQQHIKHSTTHNHHK